MHGSPFQHKKIDSNEMGPARRTYGDDSVRSGLNRYFLHFSYHCLVGRNKSEKKQNEMTYNRKELSRDFDARNSADGSREMFI